MIVSLRQACEWAGVDYDEKCRQMDEHTRKVCAEHNIPLDAYPSSACFERLLEGEDDLAMGIYPSNIYQAGNFHIYLHEFLGRDFVDFSWGYDPDTYYPNYGVCDSERQFLELMESHDSFKQLKTDRKFIVALWPMLKSEQPSSGGWRWHKWGEYYGVENPQNEYLYDEEGIDRVECFHVYEVKRYEEQTPKTI